MSMEEIKKKAGYTAAEFVEEGMKVGLGTGSTAFFFIQRLIQRCQEGLKISAVASSKQSEELARKGGVPILDINEITSLDLTVDGADEIDSCKRMIKGGGGAHVREKIVASMSKEMVVIVDESKLCLKLGSKKLPVEIIPFGIKATEKKLSDLHFHGSWRKCQDGSFFVTDNSNYIYDITFEKLLERPESIHETLLQIPGVVDTGFFFNLAGRVVIGFFDGQIVVQG